MSKIRTGRPNGRPPTGRTPLTPEQVEQLVGALSVGADLALGAKTIGISRSGLHNLMNDDEDLRERVNDARAVADGVVVKSLYTLATQKNPNPLACIYWLNNRQPLEWRQRREFFDAPGSGEPVQVIFKFPAPPGETKAQPAEERVQ